MASPIKLQRFQIQNLPSCDVPVNHLWSRHPFARSISVTRQHAASLFLHFFNHCVLSVASGCTCCLPLTENVHELSVAVHLAFYRCHLFVRLCPRELGAPHNLLAVGNQDLHGQVAIYITQYTVSIKATQCVAAGFSEPSQMKKMKDHQDTYKSYSHVRPAPIDDSKPINSHREQHSVSNTKILNEIHSTP
jgi:hypothetical protein